MKVGRILLFAAFAAFIALTKEVPIRGSTLPPEPEENNVGFEDRTNNSRNSSTSLDYMWWYYPTRRPPLSPKDFPGRPGVATWREIDLGSSKENRKTTSPTAAGVSSGSHSFPSKYHYPRIICVLFLLLSFCWT